MAANAFPGEIGDGLISKYFCIYVFYVCAKFHTCIIKRTIDSHIGWTKVTRQRKYHSLCASGNDILWFQFSTCFSSFLPFFSLRSLQVYNSFYLLLLFLIVLLIFQIPPNAIIPSQVRSSRLPFPFTFWTSVLIASFSSPIVSTLPAHVNLFLAKFFLKLLLSALLIPMVLFTQLFSPLLSFKLT